MKKVYICSPYKGDVKKNIKIAIMWSKTAYEEGYLPICPHIYLEKATGLNEKKGDREELLRLGIELLRLCDECWVCTYKRSSGMKEEIDECKKRGIEIKEKWAEKILKI